jgi:hypothetical protein
MERPFSTDRRRRFAMLAWLVALAAASAARAQASEAETLTSQGIELRRNRKNAEALELFRRAFSLAPGPRIQAHLGLAEQAVGQWLEAERDIRAGLDAQGDPWISKNRAALEQALGVVVGHLGWIEIRTVMADPEIWINGAKHPSYVPGNSIRVVAGTNTVEVRSSGYVPAMRTLMVLPNTRMTESFTLSPLPAPPQIAPLQAPPPTVTQPPSLPPVADAPPVEDRDVPTSPVVYAGLGIGAAGLLTGSVTGVLSLSRASKAKEVCVGNACPQWAQDDIDASKSLATISDVSFIVGGVGVTVGAVAWLLQPRRRAATTTSLSPVVGPQWIGVSGRF